PLRLYKGTTIAQPESLGIQLV
ncbi:uncharacterized protein METZ01_LOCUS355048, partial [marine metagenome]